MLVYFSKFRNLLTCVTGPADRQINRGKHTTFLVVVTNDINWLKCQARFLWRNLSTKHRTTPNKMRLQSTTWQHMWKNLVNLMWTAKIKLTKNWLRHSNRHCQQMTIIPRINQNSKISYVFLQSMTLMNP